ncbi:RES family NAD+ phosphorylase [Burkholderia vietnamiensis]|uniref:RES family NAD+ phosphorylase n=1 Tax=Burkholderia vietnamiensis TaxID=60552 RepID=UPI001D134DB0|nr:RES family NAD+ phosphorylase [Burkholderia vietnamiensis]UEC05633.1 RES family NAD+ phosphorylase [Burkholderia vietnamiensis]
MMDLWRISNYSDLQGLGGLRVSGRWHDRGQPVVYLAEHPALALLETMVHHEIRSMADLPNGYQLLRVQMDDDVAVAELASVVLPDDWHVNLSWTQAAGSEWLASSQSALLKVPSAILPHASNYVLNPLHPDAGRISVAEVQRVPYDPRILALLSRT